MYKPMHYKHMIRKSRWYGKRGNSTFIGSKSPRTKQKKVKR